VSNPYAKEDFNKAKAILFSMRTARIPLDESKFVKWVDAFRLQGRLRSHSIMGEARELRAKPSVLLISRL
jgi:hypothetical protein